MWLTANSHFVVVNLTEIVITYMTTGLCIVMIPGFIGEGRADNFNDTLKVSKKPVEM